MTTTYHRVDLGERLAQALLAAARAAARYRLTLSSVGLLLILLAGSGYLMLDSLQIQPLRGHYNVRVELARSGGLLPNQDVTLRGQRIGRVTSIDIDGDRVIAVAAVDDGVKIPASGTVRVAALSAAGEQYLEFVPSTDAGPYLSDGALVSHEHTSTPVTMATMLNDLNGPLAQIPPAKIHAIEQELGAGSAGPDKLAAILDGGMFMISTLDSVLPQTVSLLHNSKTVLTTLGDTSEGLRDTSRNLSRTLAGIDRMTGGFQTLVDKMPATLALADTIIADNSPTMVQLLGNLVTVSQMSYLHVPALTEFFYPRQRAGSTLDAIASAFHGGAVWALASPYPNYSCDYNVPRLPGAVPDFPEPYLNVRCANTDPSVLVRGAANAPRPPGDNTAVAPPGSARLATADPTPKGPLTIPTPYGGEHTP